MTTKKGKAQKTPKKNDGRQALAVGTGELNSALHHVMLDKELDRLGAPKEQSGGKLSPFGRLRIIGPQLLADKRRLDWLEKQHSTLAAVKEQWSEEVVLWWQVVDGKRSLSGHPLASPREAIDAAMHSPNEKAQTRSGESPSA